MDRLHTVRYSWDAHGNCMGRIPVPYGFQLASARVSTVDDESHLIFDVKPPASGWPYSSDGVVEYIPMRGSQYLAPAKRGGNTTAANKHAAPSTSSSAPTTTSSTAKAANLHAVSNVAPDRRLASVVSKIH